MNCLMPMHTGRTQGCDFSCKMLFKYLSPFFVWAAAMCYLFFTPGNRFSGSFFPEFLHADKLMHVILFAGYAFFLFMGLWKQNQFYILRGKAAIIAFWSALAFGLTVEIIQGNFVESRSFESYDLLADVIGTAAGLKISEWQFFTVR